MQPLDCVQDVMQDVKVFGFWVFPHPKEIQFCCEMLTPSFCSPIILFSHIIVGLNATMEFISIDL